MKKKIIGFIGGVALTGALLLTPDDGPVDSTDTTQLIGSAIQATLPNSMATNTTELYTTSIGWLENIVINRDQSYNLDYKKN